MNPLPILIYGFVVIITIIGVLLSYMNKDRKRTIFVVLTSSFVIIVLLFTFLRPVFIEADIEKRQKIIEPYLNEKYPDKKWKFYDIAYNQESGFRDRNPKYIGVIFEDKPNDVFYYLSDKNGNIEHVASDKIFIEN